MADVKDPAPPEEPELVDEQSPVVTNGEQLPQPSVEEQEAQTAAADQAVRGSLVTLGFVNFDGSAGDNATTGVMVSEERRQHFRRDVYVGIRDVEQHLEFLGRIVEGPFHAPHEISVDSALSRVTVLHPDRTRFRPTYYVHGTVEVLGEVTDAGGLVPTSTRPRPYSEIQIFPADRLREMLGIDGEFFIGHLMGYQAVQVHADISSKNFLPRNVGVFGTVGSGKSNTTQVLMEEALAAGWAVIVVDVEGEYVRMEEASDDVRLIDLMRERFGIEPGGVNDFRVYVPSRGGSDAARPIHFKVPISAIEPEIISNILEFSEPQSRMFERAVGAAPRLVQQQAGGRPAPAGRLGNLAGGRPQAATQGRPFTLQTLIDGLVETNSQTPLLGQLAPAEVSTAWALRSKLMGLGGSQVLDWNATSNVPELPVDDLLVGGRLSVIDVSETADRSRNITISYVLQALFDRVSVTEVDEAMGNGLPRPKVLVIIEEVHTFVSRQSVSKMRAIVDQLQIISRRGRKRWMGLTLVSQQPGHVPDELFELTNTRFIHQLKSTTNILPVKQTTGGVHEALWATVPSLGPGQCLLTGAVFRHPIFTTVRPARSRRLLTN
jgi:DNA helicase HerA-like ATPase